ncbi:DUF5658 family protein [Chloroflexota bacterium]
MNVIKRLSYGGLAAERVLFARDRSHWTNSFVLWVTLNGVDSLLTWQHMSIGGHELNPFLGLAIQTYGEGAMLIGKMALAVLFGTLVWRWGSHRLKSTLNLGMNVVVIVNCLFLLKPMWLLHMS